MAVLKIFRANNNSQLKQQSLQQQHLIISLFWEVVFLRASYLAQPQLLIKCALQEACLFFVMSQIANLSVNLIDPDGLLLISDSLLLGRCMNEWLTFVDFFWFLQYSSCFNGLWINQMHLSINGCFSTF